MSVQNRIVKVQKRNRALVRFDQDLITHAIARAAASIGGFEQDLLPGINDRLMARCGEEPRVAEFLSDAVVVCLNSEPQYLISNFPPTIEAIQDVVLHVLNGYGFQNTADAFACYRWGRHWLREGAITAAQFVGNGLGRPYQERCLARNRAQGCDTVAGLNEIVRAGRIRGLIDASLAHYERELDEAAAAVMARVNTSGRVRLLWVTGPSSSGKTTTTLKLIGRFNRQGLRLVMLSLDDYFWPLIDHPTDWINDRNYETPEALDIQMLNRHLRELLEGRTIEQPVYSFKEGRRTATRPVRLHQDDILLLDCLHGLYPPIAEGIDGSAQFRLYLDAHNMIYEGDGSTRRLTRFTDLRLMRRILRDARHRSHAPLRTLLHWHYVRAGELFAILPLSGLADHVLNGGFAFDLPALHPYLLGAGGLWPEARDLGDYPGFLDARIRHLHIDRLLRSVEPLSREQLADHRLIPGDAVLREFIGGSTVPIPHNE